MKISAIHVHVIRPAVMFQKTPNYELNLKGERGKPVAADFEYNSGTNPHFLSVEEIRAMIRESALHGW